MSPGGQSSRARRLLMLDTGGAALTAAITLGLLASGVIASGVPLVVWWGLGSLAAGIGLQGLVALWRSWPLRLELRRVAVANVVYAFASTIVVVVFRGTVTGIVVAYVVIEAVVLVALAVAEWHESRRIR